MSNKQLTRAMRSLRDGIKIYRKNETLICKDGTFHVETDGVTFRGVITTTPPNGESFVSEMWETCSLKQLLKIAGCYFPAVTRAVGPARNFVGL